jgi:hypothetical protein
MNRKDRRRRGERSSKYPRPEPAPDLTNLTLSDMRFDTPAASALFMQLRYQDPAYIGSRDDAVRLPPVEQSASTTPSSGGMVFKAFPHGLMYGDQMSLMAGMGLFLALILTYFGSMHLFFGGESLISWLLTFDSEEKWIFLIPKIFLLLVSFVFSPVFLMVIVSDLMGFRFERSPLFDRNASKIHLFSDKSVPWAPWRHQLKTYDWRCVRGEIDTVTLFAGMMLRKEAGLRCVVMDRPGGDTVIDEFVLGVNLPAEHIQPLLDTWEHLRRFMQREGPLFADQHDKPNPSLGRQSLWQHLLAGPKFEYRITVEMFQIAREDKNPFALVAGLLGVLLSLPLFWLFALWGILPWLSGLVKRDPIWPPEVIASVGGASLHAKELEVWRGVIPEN